MSAINLCQLTGTVIGGSMVKQSRNMRFYDAKVDAQNWLGDCDQSRTTLVSFMPSKGAISVEPIHNNIEEGSVANIGQEDGTEIGQYWKTWCSQYWLE